MMRNLVLLGGLTFLLGGCSKRVMVTSEPPGAEIFLNQKPTGLKTPAELLVTRKYDFQDIELHLVGYHQEHGDTQVEKMGPCCCWMPFYCCAFWAGGGDGSSPPPGSFLRNLSEDMGRTAFFFSAYRVPSRIHIKLVPTQTFASIQKELVNVKTIKSLTELDRLFYRLTAGGTWTPGSPYPGGRVWQLPDGTTLGLRWLSKAGSGVIDVLPPPGHPDETARSGKDKPYCVYNLVMLGVDDWVQTPKVAEIAAQVGGAATPDQIRDLSLRMIRAAVRQGLMEVGDATQGDPGFRKWDLPSEEALQRVEREWTALGRMPSLGEICWLRNTEKGDEMGKRLLKSSPSTR